MAIQFNCPHCSATIRVDDSTSGKAGKCPQCQLRILVPVLPPDVSSGAAPSQSVDSGSTPNQNSQADPQPTEQSSPVDPETGFPQLVTSSAKASSRSQAPDFSGLEAVDVSSQPSVSKRFRRQRNRNKAGLLIPLAFGGMLLTGVVYVYKNQQINLEGNLTATVVNNPRLEPKMLQTKLVSLPESTTDAVLEELSITPERLSTELMETHMIGVPEQGIKVRIQRGTRSRFYEIRLDQDENLVRFLGKYGSELKRKTTNSLELNSKLMFEDWKTSIDKKESMSIDNMQVHRDNVALATLVDGLGFFLVAKVAGTRYRCVYEDNKSLYFLLPPNVKQFELEGRTISGETNPFDGRYKVTVR